MSDAPLRFPAEGPLGRLSALMCVAVAVGGALAEIALAWVWLTPSLVEAYVVPELRLQGVPVALDVPTRLLAFAVSMIPMSVLLIMLHCAYRLFDDFRLGLVFTVDAVIGLRRIGSCILALAVLRPVTATLLSLILTWSNPPGQRILALSLGVDDYMAATLGGLVFAIGYVMADAARIADDNRQIV